MNLKGAIFYLSGPIDDVRLAEHATDWRENITIFLQSLGCGVFNPMDKPINYPTACESYENVQVRKSWKQQEKFDDVYRTMKAVCSTDMRLVDLSHAMILYIDRDVHMCGSYIETAWAALERKPIVVMCKQGKVAIPDFLYGITPHEMFFSNWYDVKRYIYGVHSCADRLTLNKRWQFIDINKVYGNNERNI